MTFAEWLIRSDTPRVQAARLLGVSRATITDLCSGRRRPALDLALRIADLAGGQVPVAVWREAA